MTQLQKLKIRLGITDTLQDTLLQEYLDASEMDILNKRFPFGFIQVVIDEDTGEKIYVEVKPPLEAQYFSLQIDLAIVKYNMRGIEGQDKHSENGISRTYHDTLLSQVMPFCKVL